MIILSLGLNVNRVSSPVGPSGPTDDSPTLLFASNEFPTLFFSNGGDFPLIFLVRNQ